MYRPDTLDRQIISLLQQDGRVCYAEIARALDVSEATARRRVERLITEGVIEVVACVEPRRIGLQAEALVYLQCDLDKLTQIGQRLAAMPEVREALYTSGAHDMVLRIVLPSGDDLLPFLTRRVAPIPGIKTTQTSYILHKEKRIKDWQVAELPEEDRPTPPACTLLLVDDDADFVAAAQMVLEASGCRVITAGNGREALQRLREEPPALVLLELIMETPLAGLNVAHAIRAERQLQGLPIVAISNIRSTEWASKLPPVEELPFDDFVEKPIEPSRLLETVRRFID